MKRSISFFLVILFTICIVSGEEVAQKKIVLKKRFILDSVFVKLDVLREAFIERGWLENTKKESANFHFKWTWTVDRLKVTDSSDQIVNHFDNFDEIGSKTGLLKNLRLLQEQDPSVHIDDFFPTTFILGENSTEFPQFLDAFNKAEAAKQPSVPIDDPMLLEQHVPHSVNKNIWIAKPGSGARGVGIKLFDNVTKLENFLIEKNSSFVVQKYIENPLIVSNKKFDIRQFVLVTSLNPLTIFIYDDCYLRFTAKDYTTENIDDQFVHLTNHQVQKNYEKFHESEIKENQWSLAMFKDYLGTELNRPNAWDTVIKPQIESLVVTSLKSWPKQGHRNYSFELLGFDILLDRELKPYLLEINTNPGVHMLTDIVRPHHTNAQRDLLKVVLDSRDVWATIENEIPPVEEQEKLFGKWRLVHKDKTVVPITRPPSTKKSSWTLTSIAL